VTRDTSGTRDAAPGGGRGRRGAPVSCDAMPSDESPAVESYGPEEPDSADEAWPELAEHVKQASAALESGLIDARGILDLVETADDAEVRSTVANYIHTFIRVAEGVYEAVESLQQFLGGREAIAHAQYTAELRLLSRIDELGKDAGAEALSKLAGAYAALRSVSVAPGVYEPDDRD
jgi:hypothetical protein